MPVFTISKHAREQMSLRGISEEIVIHVLENPQQILSESNKKIYQSIINFTDRKYLVRVIVNTEKESFNIITVYRTSKIEKYYEG